MTSVETLFVKCKKHRADGTDTTLNFKGALDLLFSALGTMEMHQITRIDPGKYPVHPQVNALQKLERESANCNGMALTSEEFTSIGRILFQPHILSDHNSKISKRILE
jgi:hypothetical protein